MAPEVIRHEPYGTPADVYSFTVLLCCLLKGENYPYSDRFLTPSQAATAVAKRDLRPHVPSRMPAPLAQLLTMGWAPDPASRPDIHTLLRMLVSAELGVREQQRQKEEDRNRRESGGIYAFLWGTE